MSIWAVDKVSISKVSTSLSSRLLVDLSPITPMKIFERFLSAKYLALHAHPCTYTYKGAALFHICSPETTVSGLFPQAGKFKGPLLLW